MVESIDSLECKFEVDELRDGAKIKRKGTYARKGSSEKFTLEKAGNSNAWSAVRVGEELRDIVFGSGAPGTLAGEKLASVQKRGSETSIHPLDLWTQLNFRGASSNPKKVEKANDVFENKKRFAEVREQVGPDRHSGVVVETTAVQRGKDDEVKHSSSAEYDDAFNGLLVRTWQEGDSKKFKYSMGMDLLKVTEFAPGIYLPSVIERSTLKDGKKVITSTMTLKDLKVNHKIPAEAMELKFPKGTRVQDYVQGVEYTAGEDGKADGPTRPLPKMVSPTSPGK